MVSLMELIRLLSESFMITVHNPVNCDESQKYFLMPKLHQQQIRMTVGLSVQMLSPDIHACLHASQKTCIGKLTRFNSEIKKIKNLRYIILINNIKYKPMIKQKSIFKQCCKTKHVFVIYNSYFKCKTLIYYKLYSIF